MNSTVFRAFAQIFSSSACMNSRVCASSAANGSSISSTTGSAASARARFTRCCMPPESSPGKCLLEPARPTSFTKWSARCAHRRLVEALLHLHAIADVAGDGAPRQQARVLEHHGAIGAGAVDARAVDRRPCLLRTAAARRRCSSATSCRSRSARRWRGIRPHAPPARRRSAPAPALDSRSSQ